MSADTVAELIADLIRPRAPPLTAPTPAKPAKAAIPQAQGGSTPYSWSCEDLRIPANVEQPVGPAAADSQSFAAVRNPVTGPQSKHWRGFSQESQYSQGSVTTVAPRGCEGCAHRLRTGTCAEPVVAGLAEYTSIVWPPAGYGAACKAWVAKVPHGTADADAGLTAEQRARCHEGGWPEAETACFTARRDRFMRRGSFEVEAEALAEKLTLRDRDGDDRHTCFECSRLSGHGVYGWRCGAARFAGVAPALPSAMVTVLQRCPGFAS